MLPTEHPVFRGFWYPVLPSDQLPPGELRAVTLLDQPVVLWRGRRGPVALADRCSHRAAKLSCGKLQNGFVTCPYHGWAFSASGKCVDVPQQPKVTPSPSHAVPAYHCQERYGYLWVALDEPAVAIPEVAEDLDPEFRRIPCFFERWNTSAFRTMENELDMSHFAFVHTGTFGDNTHPVPLSFELEDLDEWSLQVRAELATVATVEQAANTHMPEGESSRKMKVTWFMPFMARLDIHYDSGLKHVIINCSTPVSGDQVQVVQFHYRSDTEAEVPTDQLLAFESRIVAEDRVVLENVDPRMPLFDFKAEAHTPSDRAGLLMRQKLAAAIERYDQENAA